MFVFSKLRLVFVALLLATCGVRAQAPLTVEGLADRQYPGYADRVTFRVPSAAGHSYSVALDGNAVPTDTSIEVNSVDYHELIVWRTNTTTLETTNRRIQFIVRASERASTEVGLPAWTPYPTIPSAAPEFSGAQLRLIAPQRFPAGYPIPVVAWINKTNGDAVRANGQLVAPGQPSISIKRGVGSGFLAATNASGFNYTPAIGHIQTNKIINIEASTSWTSVSGVLGASTAWPENARILATGSLTVPAGGTLTIGAGAVVRLNSRVDITNNGTIVINGTVDRPVVFMPNSPSQPWGGFIMRAGTGEITATAAIFTGSGAEQNWFGANGNPGSHRDEQALFYVHNDQRVTLTDSAAIFLAGQLGHSLGGGEFNLTRFLLQRSTTGGEYTGANFTVNDSAFIEAPDESPTFVDGDNDLLYLVSGRHGFTNTLFGWCKDDGIDSGGSSAGVFHYEKCWFEGAFHEGNSLSGNGKDVRHRNGVFINCGQGLEAGYEGPTGRLDHCFASANLVGGRFGDNYNWSYAGALHVTNSILIHNHRDVWGMNWVDWTYRVGQMDVRNNLFTVPNTNHPANSVWNPATDAQHLVDFMTTPPDAPVGVGFATWQNQFDIGQFPAAFPVRLSSFTPQSVRIEWTLETPAQTLATGTLEFTPGETVKLIESPISSVSGHEYIRLSLRNPQNAEITGFGTLLYFRSAALIPRGAVWRYLDTGVDQMTAWRALNFNDAAWEEGPAQLGFGETDEATPISDNNQLTTYFRHKFYVSDPADFTSLSMWLLRDDAGVVFLNGVEVYRTSGLPPAPATISYTNLASTTFENQQDTSTIPVSRLVAGTNIAAVEIHQESAGSSDVSFDFELTGNSPVKLRLLVFGDDKLLFWSDPQYLLESATSADGMWTAVGSPSPFTIIPSEPQRFYRLRR